jgi:hypothetical protein
MLEHTVNVTGSRSIGRSSISFHAVDELDDAIGSSRSAAWRPVVIGGGLLEQLGGAADARQWIRDLVASMAASAVTERAPRW